MDIFPQLEEFVDWLEEFLADPFARIVYGSLAAIVVIVIVALVVLL